MSIDMPLESASLAQLQQTPIDNVLNIIDEGLVHLPTYRELYYRWERQQWKAQDIDFSPDRKQWEMMGQEEQRMRLFGLSAFFQGEACVTDTLAPYVTAMPDEEMRFFLTTQLVDEARHTVFFARFFSEALGIDSGRLEETLAIIRENVNAHLRYILIDSLTEVSERIRREPQKLLHLIEGITLYHVIVEGTMALAGQRNILELYRQIGLFPAFRSGFTAVARDESRHVIFGVKFLPSALAGISPAPEQIPNILAAGADPWLSPRYAQESLRKKLKVIGLSIEMPSVPPPPPPPLQ